ncbi:MAG: MBL fold metallo-hydrolase [Proteobacteria bacterium]|nr:MAG: MBL fold metallo-hydrolase [Pseudomonadota bacterium]
MLGTQSLVVSSVVGNTQMLDGGAMFGNAPRPLWERWVAPDATGRIPLACRALLIEIGAQKVLCETGIGSYMAPDMALRYGVVEREHKLLESLDALGLTDESIDFVILSHLHFDHAGGLLKSFKENAPIELLFPNAQFVVGKTAWERAKHPHSRDKASFIPGLCELLEASGRLIIVEGEVIPGLPKDIVSFRISEGHTPGQLHTVIKGQKHTMVYAGDLIPGKAWVHLPITMGYDRYPEKVIDEKEDLYQDVVKDHWIVFYTHDSKVAASEIQKDEKGRYSAVHEHGTLNRFALN